MPLMLYFLYTLAMEHTLSNNHKITYMHACMYISMSKNLSIWQNDMRIDSDWLCPYEIHIELIQIENELHVKLEMKVALHKDIIIVGYETLFAHESVQF